MKLLSSTTPESTAWSLAIVLISGIVFSSLFYLGLQLEVLVIVAAVGLIALYIGGLPAYKVVIAAVFISMFLNVANYTFLSFTAEGAQAERTAETQLLVLMRLPILMFAVLVVLFRYGSEYLYYLRSNWDVFLFSIVPFASAFFAFNKVTAIQYAVWFFLAFQAMLALFYLLGTRREPGTWSESIAWILLISNILLVVFAVFGLQQYHGEGVLTSAYAGSNIHTKACAIVIAALLVLERQRRSPLASTALRRFPVVLMLVIGAAAVITLIFGAKRSPIIGVGVTLLVYFFAGTFNTPGRRRGSLWRTVILLVPMVYLAWQILPDASTTLHRFDKTGDLSRDRSTEERLEIWANSVQTVSEFPVFGVGLDNGDLASKMIAPASDVAGYGLHNTYLGVLVEMGIVGALVLLVIMLRSFYIFCTKCYPSLRWNIVILACTPLLVSVVEYNVTPGQFTFWPIWIAVLMPRIATARQTSYGLHLDPYRHDGIKE